MPKKAHPLVAQFKKAGLVLKVEDDPIVRGRGTADIVQIDVGRSFKGNSRTEWFRMYIPDQGALLQVRNVDKKIGQLLLLIKEKENTFETDVQFSPWGGDKWAVWLSRQRDNLARGAKIKKTYKPGSKQMRRGGIVIESKTDPETRYFLMGLDERQLFIAQLTGAATTVKDAHNMLGSSIQFAEGKRKGSRADRQGEWFFLETDADTRREVNTAIRKNITAVLKNVSIGVHAGRAGGNPHTVDELVKLPPGPALEHGFAARPRERVFIKGKVRHVDHRTIKFSHWREVIANNEGATASASAAGIAWVD